MNRKNLETWAMTAPLEDLDDLTNRLALICATRVAGEISTAAASKKKPGRKRGRKPGLPVTPDEVSS